MPTNKEIEVVLTLKDEASKKMQSARASIKEFSKSTKDSVAPILQLRSAWMKVGLAWGVTAGLITKGVQEIAQLDGEILKLDISAIKLGVTTSELSKRMYGFNIATESARLGASKAKGFLESIGNAFRWLKVKGAELIGETALETRSQNLAKNYDWSKVKTLQEQIKVWEDLRAKAKQELNTEKQQQQSRSAETIQIEEQLTGKIKQLALSSYEYKKYILQQEVDVYRASGVTKEKIAEYQAAQQMVLLQSQYGFARWTDFMDDSFRQSIGSWKTLLSSFMTDSFNGELKKGTDYFLAFGQSLNKIFANMLSEMIMRWALFGEGIGDSKIGQWMGIAGKIGGLFGGGMITGGVGGTNTGMQTAAGINGGNAFPTWSPYHRGGMISPLYAHTGLAPDEIPIIARRNEGVLTHIGVAAAGGSDGIRQLNSGKNTATGGNINITFAISTIDQKTGAEFLLKNAKVIGQAVAVEFIKNNPALRGSSKRYG